MLAAFGWEIKRKEKREKRVKRHQITKFIFSIWDKVQLERRQNGKKSK